MKAWLYRYTHAQTVFTLWIVINRAELARNYQLIIKLLVIIKHKYMIICNYKIVINIMLCLLNSTVAEPRCQTWLAIGQIKIQQSVHFIHQ